MDSWGTNDSANYPPTGPVWHWYCRQALNERRLDILFAEEEAIDGADQHWPDDAVTAAALGGYVL